MKVTIEVDCTPAEARQFVGLPDLQPMQERLLGEMEQRFRDAASKMSPELVMQQWFSAIPAGVEQMRQAWERLVKAGMSSKD